MSFDSEVPQMPTSLALAEAAEQSGYGARLQPEIPPEAYQSPLVDALMERLRQIHAARQMPH